MFTVWFDSGIRMGSNVTKSSRWVLRGFSVSTMFCLLFYNEWFADVHDEIVLGGSGRPIMYGLALGGEEGVEQVLRGLLADTEVTLGLSSYKGNNELWGKREAVLENVENACRCIKL
jgi:hypothetical protein